MVGGGFHGKSTVLQAIQLGIYNHIPGDGREWVVTCPSAIKIRAEEGRSIQGVDISPFINDLPRGQSTTQFSTQNASGSPSQAARIIEAMEAETQMLMLDEDPCATNFMIRDRRMQALIAAHKEPITPFVDQVRSLFLERQISSILVMGGSGDYFEVADTVIGMDEFIPHDLTQDAQAIAAQYPTQRQPEIKASLTDIAPRFVSLCFSAPSTRRIKIKIQGLSSLSIGDQTVDLRGHEQFVEGGQLEAIAQALLTYYQQSSLAASPDAIATLIQALTMETGPTTSGWLSDFRPIDVAFVINRLRSLDIQSITTRVSEKH